MAGTGRRLPAADRLVATRRIGTLLGRHHRSRPPLIDLRARRGRARTRLQDGKNTVLTYLHIEYTLIFGAGIIGIAFLAVSLWWGEAYNWRWSNR